MDGCKMICFILFFGRCEVFVLGSVDMTPLKVAKCRYTRPTLMIDSLLNMIMGCPRFNQ